MFFEDVGDLFLVSAHHHGVDHRENGLFAAKIGQGGKSGEGVAIGHEIVEDAVEELVVGNELGGVLLQDEESGAGEDVVDVLGVWIFGDALDFCDGESCGAPIWIVRSKRRSRGSRAAAGFGWNAKITMATTKMIRRGNRVCSSEFAGARRFKAFLLEGRKSSGRLFPQDEE